MRLRGTIPRTRVQEELQTPSMMTPPEIGAARVLDLEMISLFLKGTMNVLKHHGIVAGPIGRTGKDVSVFVGNSAFPILATAGGLVEHLVKLNDKVEAGQKVAIQRNRSRAY
jgi:uncharacterized protein